jgi:Zn finger protein HypA/HybF involved in hydrogenase expression
MSKESIVCWNCGEYIGDASDFITCPLCSQQLDNERVITDNEDYTEDDE